MTDQTSLEQRLETVRRVLEKLEERAAGYTSLTVPTELVIQLEDKRNEVERLESMLEGDEGEALPNTLPRRVPFFGREREMERAMDALSPRDRGWGLMIDGIGGIGKTALAVEVGHRCYEQARFDVVLFTTAKRTRLTAAGERQLHATMETLDGMLSQVARDLGALGVAQQSGEDGEEKRQALLDFLRRYSGPRRRVLLIFDNLETLPRQDLTPLFEFLRYLPQPCKAIVTSRRRAGEGAVWLRLEKISWPTARALIEEEMRCAPRLERTLTRAGRARWQALYDATGGSPLALKWILGLMRVRNLSLERALALLRDEAAEDSPLHEFIYREARADMGADDWRVLGALSLFAAPASFEALTAVTEMARLALESALERLDAYALVDVEGPDGPYALHPLTRRLAADELRGQPELARGLRTRFARYWVDYAERHGGDDKDAYQTFDRLEAAWPNLEAAADLLWEGRDPVSVRDLVSGDAAGGEDAEAGGRMLNDLVGALSSFLWFSGYWDEQVHLNTRTYQAMAALERWRDAGWCAMYVAWVYYYRAETDQAAAWTARMAEAMERDGTPRDRAVATRMRGLVARQRGDLAEAERLLTEALEMFRDELSDNDMVSAVLNDLGGVAREREAYDRAEGYYREALELAEEMGDREFEASYLGNLGRLALVQGRPDEARTWFERALPLAQEVGSQTLIADAQWGLARVLEEEGRYAEALPRSQEALEIYERLRHRNVGSARDLVARLREKV